MVNELDMLTPRPCVCCSYYWQCVPLLKALVLDKPSENGRYDLNFKMFDICSAKKVIKKKVLPTC